MIRREQLPRNHPPTSLFTGALRRVGHPRVIERGAATSMRSGRNRAFWSARQQCRTPSLKRPHYLHNTP